jgi:hypothetical protein
MGLSYNANGIIGSTSLPLEDEHSDNAGMTLQEIISYTNICMSKARCADTQLTWHWLSKKRKANQQT